MDETCNHKARLHEERPERHRRARSERSPHRARARKGGAEGTRAVHRGLVRGRNRGGERRRILSVHVRNRVRGPARGVRTLDLDGLDEGVEVAGGLVVRVVPVDDPAGPLNCALPRSRDAGGPDAGKSKLSRARGDFHNCNRREWGMSVE